MDRVLHEAHAVHAMVVEAEPAALPVGAPVDELADEEADVNKMSDMPDYRPKSGKIEWHITYRCNLGCKACTRCSWMNPPHTGDMTLDDAYECMRQADAIGWRKMPGPGNGAERPRVLILGGEPTLHPDFLEFVRLAREWTGTYVQILSNGYSEETRRLLNVAQRIYGAPSMLEGFKNHPRQAECDGSQLWHMETYVSPAEANLPFAICYCHSSQICGIGADHSGYSPCPIGLMVSKVLGVEGVTKNFADLYDIEKSNKMTLAICEHCGFEKLNRYGPMHLLDAFKTYAASCPKVRGAPVSPIWMKAFQRLGINGTS